MENESENKNSKRRNFSLFSNFNKIIAIREKSKK